MLVIDVSQADIFSIQHNYSQYSRIPAARAQLLVNSEQSALRAVVSFSVCWDFIIKCGG
jgi:hypothetical protein